MSAGIVLGLVIAVGGSVLTAAARWGVTHKAYAFWIVVGLVVAGCTELLSQPGAVKHEKKEGNLVNGFL